MSKDSESTFDEISENNSIDEEVKSADIESVGEDEKSDHENSVFQNEDEEDVTDEFESEDEEDVADEFESEYEDDDESRDENEVKSSGRGIKVALISVLAIAVICAGIWGVKIYKDKKNGSLVGSSGENVELGKYDGVEVSIKVTQDDIDSEIESLKEEYTTYEEKQGTIEDGDMVYAEFKGSIDGKEMEELSDSDYVEIGSESYYEDFEKAFIGKKTGEKFTFEITFPEGAYDDDAIDGKTAKFEAKAKYICGEEIVPEYDDDLVQSISDEYKTTAEYTEYLKKQLQEEYEDEKDEYAWSEVVDNSKVKKYPENLMETARDSVLKDYYSMADMYGYTHDEIFQAFGNEDEEDFVKNSLDDLAKDTVKETLIAKAIAEKENIKYTQKQYDEVLEEEYSYNTEEYDNKSAYEEANKDYLEEEALKTAVKAWISEHAKFKS